MDCGEQTLNVLASWHSCMRKRNLAGCTGTPSAPKCKVKSMSHLSGSTNRTCCSWRPALRRAWAAAAPPAGIPTTPHQLGRAAGCSHRNQEAAGRVRQAAQRTACVTGRHSVVHRLSHAHAALHFCPLAASTPCHVAHPRSSLPPPLHPPRTLLPHFVSAGWLAGTPSPLTAANTHLHHFGLRGLHREALVALGGRRRRRGQPVGELGGGDGGRLCRHQARDLKRMVKKNGGSCGQLGSGTGAA